MKPGSANVSDALEQGAADQSVEAANPAAGGEDLERAERERSERSSDAHDPNAKAAWIGLLSFLSDDELTRYGEIAEDQLAREWRLGPVQWAAAIAGLLLMAFTGFAALRGDLTFWVAATGLAIGFSLDYWAYKKVKARTLWRSHIAAVADEQIRRSGNDA